jgi:cytoskeletal protein CcmA (bactofilin family)
MTHIGASIIINGALNSDEDLQIDGQVKGEIVTRQGTLVIGKSANIDADVRGARITVRGRVDGNISASQRIELGASAEVTGSLSANFVVLADGALFNGQIDMGQRTIAAKVAQHRADRVEQADQVAS